MIGFFEPQPVSTWQAHSDWSWGGPIRMKHRTQALVMGSNGPFLARQLSLPRNSNWVIQFQLTCYSQASCNHEESQPKEESGPPRTGRENQRNGAGALIKPFWKPALTVNFSATWTTKFSSWFLLLATQSILTRALGMWHCGEHCGFTHVHMYVQYTHTPRLFLGRGKYTHISTSSMTTFDFTKLHILTLLITITKTWNWYIFW